MTEELPPLRPLVEDSVESLLEASRGIVLEGIEGYGIKLSKFTRKQLSRANPIRNGSRRSGLHLRKVKKKMAWQTKRKKKREYNRTARQQYHQLKLRFGLRWAITLEVWLDEVAPYLEGYRVKVGVYDKEAPVDIENLWVSDKTSGAKLWEGAEERLRRLGYML
jgi:hypothetical protein